MRVKVPEAVQTEILTHSRRRCCLCTYLEGDKGRKRGQIAHIDRDPANSAFDNLAYLCLEHHDEYDSRTSQSKSLTEGEIKTYRNRLYEENDSPPTQQSEFSDNGYPAFLGIDELPRDEKVFIPDTPGVIMHELRLHPPLQRGQIEAERFKGRWVRWSGTVGALKEGDHCYQMTVQSQTGVFFVTFPFSSSVLLNSILEGDEVLVEGQLRRADECVELVNPNIIVSDLS